MTRSDLDHLQPGPRRQIFLFDEGVWVAAGSTGKPRLIASLPSYIHALSDRDPLAAALLPNVIGDAGPLIQGIHETRFCFNELIPQLRALCGARPIAAPKRLEELVQRAASLESAIAGQLFDEPYADLLAAMLGVPYALMARAAIPLERITRRRKSDLFVDVEGHGKYRYRVDRAQSLSDFTKHADQTLFSLLQDTIGSDETLRADINNLRTLARSMFQAYGAKRQGAYHVFHSDSAHELQYSGGAWILVRGPLARRLREGHVCVGLPIRGRSRDELLSEAPAVAGVRNRFWHSVGVPARSGICMGSHRQYKRLMGARFNDAEAIVHWLDAAAILASQRSDLHRRWRSRVSDKREPIELEQVPF